MYEREVSNGYKVEWNPSNEQLAAQAMGEVNGTGVTAVDLPEQANVPVEAAVARNVRERYQELCAHSLSVSFEDGEVASGGTDTETVTVELRDADENLVAGANTAVLDVDGYKYDVPLTDGRGTYALTTSKDPGSNVAVQAVEVPTIDTSDDLRVEPGRESAVNVA